MVRAAIFFQPISVLIQRYYVILLRKTFFLLKMNAHWTFNTFRSFLFSWEHLYRVAKYNNSDNNNNSNSNNNMLALKIVCWQLKKIKKIYINNPSIYLNMYWFAAYIDLAGEGEQFSLISCWWISAHMTLSGRRVRCGEYARDFGPGEAPCVGS